MKELHRLTFECVELQNRIRDLVSISRLQYILNDSDTNDIDKEFTFKVAMPLTVDLASDKLQEYLDRIHDGEKIDKRRAKRLLRRLNSTLKKWIKQYEKGD